MTATHIALGWLGEPQDSGIWQIQPEPNDWSSQLPTDSRRQLHTPQTDQLSVTTAAYGFAIRAAGIPGAALAIAEIIRTGPTSQDIVATTTK